MKNSLSNHIKVVHEKDKYQHFCSVCGKKYATKFLVAKHEEKVHSKEAEENNQKRFDCQMCSARQMTSIVFR